MATLSLDCLMSHYLAISHHVIYLQCFLLQYLDANISEKGSLSIGLTCKSFFAWGHILVCSKRLIDHINHNALQSTIYFK